MRTQFALAAALGVALGTAAQAQDQPAPLPAPDAVRLAPADPAKRLDDLFAELKRERSDKAAERIAGRIWAEWNRSGSASIDLMMQWSQQAIDAKKFDVALDFLDQVVTLDPTYAEGWNRRATVHFLMNNFAKSMADIDRTLRLEPRHFGALSGMARILKDGGNEERALEAYERVLAVYPMMREAQKELGEIADDLAGDGA